MANRTAAMWMPDHLHAALSLASLDDRRPVQQIRVAFCTTVFRRSRQFRDALPLNLDLMYPWRDSVSWYVALFQDPAGEGAELLAWVQDTFQDAIAKGLLVLGAPIMEYWQCPVAKNTAHVFAVAVETEMSTDLNKLMLVNLDCDNLLGPGFVQSVLSCVAHVTNTRGLFISWQGKDAGLTGRMCQSAATLMEINGFNESLLPSGSQDVEVKERVVALHEQLYGYKHQRRIRDVTATGGAIPNDPTNLKNSLGNEKVKFVDPRYAGMSWGSMNAKSWAICRQQAKSGNLRRNLTKAFEDLGVPCPRVPPRARPTARGGAPPSGRTLPRARLVAAARGSAPPPSAGGPGPARPSRPLRMPPRPPPSKPCLRRPVAPAAPPSEPPRQCTVSSCGLRALRAQFPRVAKLHPAPRGHNPGDPVIAAYIAALFAAAGLATPNVVVDCRKFADPNRERGGVNHVGTHVRNLRRFVDHPLFAGWLRGMKQRIFAQYRRGNVPRIMTVCNMGRHRSVSAALLLAECLTADGFQLLLLEQVSQPMWPRGTCDNCLECRAPSEAKDDVFRRALTMWRETTDV